MPTEIDALGKVVHVPNMSRCFMIFNIGYFNVPMYWNMAMQDNVMKSPDHGTHCKLNSKTIISNIDQPFFHKGVGVVYCVMPLVIALCPKTYSQLLLWAKMKNSDMLKLYRHFNFIALIVSSILQRTNGKELLLIALIRLKRL